MGGRLLSTPGNPISLAVSLEGLQVGAGSEGGSDASPCTSTALPSGGAQSPGAHGSASLVGGPAGSGPQGDAGAGHQPSPAQAKPINGPGDSSGQPQGSSQQAGAGVGHKQQPGGRPRNATFFGSMLWARCISGTRVVARGKQQAVGGLNFVGYGSHCDDYGCDYLTAAAAVGTSEEEVDEFVARLCKCYDEVKQKQK